MEFCGKLGLYVSNFLCAPIEHFILKEIEGKKINLKSDLGQFRLPYILFRHHIYWNTF